MRGTREGAALLQCRQRAAAPFAVHAQGPRRTPAACAQIAPPRLFSPAAPPRRVCSFSGRAPETQRLNKQSRQLCDMCAAQDALSSSEKREMRTTGAEAGDKQAAGREHLLFRVLPPSPPSIVRRIFFFMPMVSEGEAAACPRYHNRRVACLRDGAADIADGIIVNAAQRAAFSCWLPKIEAAASHTRVGSARRCAASAKEARYARPRQPQRGSRQSMTSLPANPVLLRYAAAAAATAVPLFFTRSSSDTAPPALREKNDSCAAALRCNMRRKPERGRRSAKKYGAARRCQRHQVS